MSQFRYKRKRGKSKTYVSFLERFASKGFLQHGKFNNDSLKRHTSTKSEIISYCLCERELKTRKM
uniref:Uncharacterized protein n=1 Tax=Lepeophtheirus salmonis TaxID=72036 RepID=A0A0K2SWM0_LEPSM